MCTARRLMQNARSHSSVFIQSIQVCECAFALRQEQKRDHFGTVAINVHRMFHHDSTALTTRASGLGWTSAGLPHLRGVHENLRTNPVNPRCLFFFFFLSSGGWGKIKLPKVPIPKVNSHCCNTCCFMHTEFHRSLVLSSSTRVIAQFPCAEHG